MWLWLAVDAAVAVACGLLLLMLWLVAAGLLRLALVALGRSCVMSAASGLMANGALSVCFGLLADWCGCGLLLMLWLWPLACCGLRLALVALGDERGVRAWSWRSSVCFALLFFFFFVLHSRLAPCPPLAVSEPLCPCVDLTLPCPVLIL
jgi:hypothetical protein